MMIGLRIDVDTFRGTRLGVPNLLSLLHRYSIKASFFFSVGPDNMGRHLFRLIRPSFFLKMFRTRAANLYGWDIILNGTIRHGPVIGEKLRHIIRAVSDAGHEVGLHAWDHQAWQTNIDRMDTKAISRELDQGVKMISEIIGKPPACSASPGWRCNDLVLNEKMKFPFKYNSDCRGSSIFRPVVEGKILTQPQIPTTLPTYDEVIGHHGILKKNYNEFMLSLIADGKLNVLTIHAEVEGISCFDIFEDFINIALSKQTSFTCLQELLQKCPEIPGRTLVKEKIPGREGWVLHQDTQPYAR